MRSLLIAVLTLTSIPVWAQVTTIQCSACRDAYEHPRDYGNHTFNQVFGSSATLSLAEGSRVKVINTSGDWAIVDLAFVLNPIGLTVTFSGVTYMINLPDGTIRIRVQDPAGNMTTYDAFAESSDLTVGSTEPTPDSEPVPVDYLPNRIPGGMEAGAYNVMEAYPTGPLVPIFDFRFNNM